MSLQADLQAAIADFAQQRPFLVALDFDGVLAPLVDDPTTSRPLPESVAAIEKLLLSEDAVVAYVSGRDLEGLTEVSTPPEKVHLVGSHGAQWQGSLRSATDVGSLTTEQRSLLDDVTSALREIVDDYPGTRMETKPAGAVLHTRLADPEVAQRATQAALDGPASLPAVRVTPGKDVVEIAVTRHDKGEAVQWLRDHFMAAAVCFMGDDVTDETAFKTLNEGDLSIKVGPGETAARFRVETPQDVSEVLAELARHIST